MPHGTDPYRDLYATRAASMTGSEIRALFAVLERPEIVSLAGGLPSVDVVVPRLPDCVERVLARASPVALQYGPANGLTGLRERLVELMAIEGIQADPHHLVVTDGAQQGLELLAKIFCDPGDVILTEAPTYVGALSAFSSFEADIQAIPTDEDGILLDGLLDAIQRLRAEGRRPKFLYVVPTFQNPSGITLDPQRRQPLVDLCAREDVLIIEDNPYAQVRFEGDPVVPLRALAPDQVIYLGTMSKVFSPGMRVGWILAPEPVRDRLVMAKEAANLCSSPFTQLLCEEYLASGHVPEDLELVRKMYRERRDAMLDAMRTSFPAEASTRIPEGGLFLWVRVSGLRDSKAMLGRALDAGVAYVPGTGFFPGRGGEDAMRLNFSYPTPDLIEEGIRRLGRVLGSELDLARRLEG